MANYCDNFDLIQEQFDQFGVNDTSDSFQSWLGLRGPAGPQGEPGKGLEIKDVVATVSDLPTSAAQGDVYLVGTASPYVAYIWNNGEWLNLGEVAVGPAGPQGPQGEDGAQGEDGTTYTPSVSEAGVISWTNDGGKPNPNPVNIKGPQGETGARGEAGPAGSDGAAATIAVGTVSGLPAGSTPTIVNSGTSSAAVFDFGIPAGATGPTGPTGPAGPGVASGGSAGQVLAKASATDYDTEWINPPSGGALYFTNIACSATTGDFATISSADITANSVVAECVFANPSAITSDVTWTTSAGSLVLNGTCSTATTVNLVLVKTN